MFDIFKLSLFILIPVLILSYFTSVLLAVLVCLTIGLLYRGEYLFNKVIELHLKVRNLTAYHYASNNVRYATKYHSTPIMQNSNRYNYTSTGSFNKSGTLFSPITHRRSTNNGAPPASMYPTDNCITSTPAVNALPLWQRNEPGTPTVKNKMFTAIDRSPRYSLSNSIRTTPTNASLESSRTPTVQTIAGPLLASTRFNINLSAYTDSKSPGLSGRIVQYSNESAQRQQQPQQTLTHQAKYNSPGQFPIVHLYKKDLPLVSPKRNKVTVRIAPPVETQTLEQQQQEINRITDSSLIESIGNGTGLNETEISTRSVLDALKEISRKRIHTEEEKDTVIETTNVTKKQRKEGIDYLTSKRLREDSPPQEAHNLITNSSTSPVMSSAKRICLVLDPITASYTSSTLMKQYIEKGIKRKAAGTIAISEKDKKLIKLTASAATQTLEDNTIQKTPNTTTPKSSKSSKNKGKAAKTSLEKSTTTSSIVQQTEEISKQMAGTATTKQREVLGKLPLFDVEPLEIARKNKLAVLLGALTGQEPILIPQKPISLVPSPKKTSDTSNVTENKSLGKEPNKNLVSIISPKNKQKHDKHVTFNIPKETTGDDVDAICPTIDLTQTVTRRSAADIEPPSPKDKDIATPALLPTEKLDFLPQAAIKTTEIPTETTKPTLFSPITNVSLGTSTVLTSSIMSNAPISSVVESVKPTYTFGNATTAKNVTESNGAKESPPVLNKAESSVAWNFTETLPATTATQVTPPLARTATFGATGTSPSNSFAKESSLTLSKAETNVAWNFMEKIPTTATAAAAAPSVQAVTFGTPNNASGNSFGSGAGMNQTTTSVAPKLGGFKFDLGKATTTASSTASTSVTEHSLIANKPINFGFGATESTIQKPEANVLATGNNSLTTAASGTPTSNALFGSTTNAECTPKSTVTFFGHNTDLNGSPKPSVGLMFGGSATNVSQTPFNFGTNASAGVKKSTSGFGAPSAVATTTAATTSSVLSGAASGFNVPQTTPSAGNAFAFTGSTNNNNNNNSKSFNFGAPPNNTAPISFGTGTATAGAFGGTASTSGFGVAATTSNGFGGGTPSGSAFASSGFGPQVNAATGFGAAPTNNAAQPTFGSNPAAVNAFGISTSAAAPSTTTTTGFGSATTTAPPPPTFGTNNTSALAFGGATTTANVTFGSGSTSAPTFGNGSSPASAFGGGGAASSAPPAFGSGASSTGPTFGSNLTTPTAFGFNATAPPAFGSTSANVPAFGAGSPSSTFGNNAAASAFGSSTVTNAFGQPTTSATAFTSSAAPAFGTASSVPAFGSNATAAPTFGASASSVPAFGSGSSGTPAFGSAAVTAFGSSATPTFGAASTTAPPAFGSTFAGNNNNAQSSAPFNSTATPASQQGFGTSFGAGASGFGSANASANSIFGTSFSSPTSFGGPPASAFGQSTSAFNATPQTQPPAFPAQTSSTFGSNNNNNQPNVQFGAGAGSFNNAGSTFGTAFPNQPTTQPSSVFSFGSAASTAPQAPFQFGSGDANKTPGNSFNFAGSATTITPVQPQMGQYQQPNMFSIGTNGNTAPRGRTQLKARRRN